VLLGTALSALLVAGCAAGQDAQTINQRPPIDGASAAAGTIAVRAAGLSAPDGNFYAKGDSAQLAMVLVNNGTSDDTLVSVTSPAAGGAQFGAAGSAAQAGGSASPSDSTSPSDSASAALSGSGSTGSSVSVTASNTSSAATSTPIPLPHGGSVMIGYGDGPSVTLTGLSQQLYPAQTIPVTLTFGSGASVTLTLAVKLATSVPSAPVVSDATEPTD
jgi:copper(I)-binding protein